MGELYILSATVQNYFDILCFYLQIFTRLYKNPPKQSADFLLYIRIKARHKLKLEKVCSVTLVDKLFFCGIVDFFRADVEIKLDVGESEIFLVGFSAKTVARSFFEQIARQSE